MAAAIAATTAGCRAEPPSPPSPHAVEYRLAWTTDGVDTSADGGGIEVTNDLGYRVHVRRGWVTSYSIELVECPKAGPVAQAATAALSLFVAGDALAGHSEGTPNPAAIRPMQVESLTDPAPRTVGTVRLAPQRYCKLHYLLARAGRDARDLPGDPDMVDTTLELEGSVRAPGATSDRPLSLRTAVAYGQLFERSAATRALQVDTGAVASVVTVRRNLARAFDGIDFAHLDDKAIGFQILRSLVDHSSVELETKRADG
jgi:hypothetical protein